MNNSINNNYNLEIEVLSPLHVGAGSEKDWVEGLDFIYDKGKLVKLNTRKMYEVLRNDISKLSNYLAKKDENGLKSLIAGKIDEITEQKFDINIKSTNDIKAFIKTGLENKPYIPGSSLKGAIRSILLNHFLNGDKPTYKKFEKDYFGSSTAGDEFMRFVKISDAHFEKTELVNTKIFNLYKEENNWKGGWKHSGGKFGKTNSKFEPKGFNTIYEIIDKWQKSKIFTISLSEKQVVNFNNNGTKKISNSKKEILQEQNRIPKKLFSIINQYTKNYIDKEIAFFTKYSNNNTQNIIDNLEEIKNSIPDDNSTCVLRMSAGSGFHSVTGDWQFNEHYIDEIEVFKGRSRGKYQHKKSAKSRKIAVSGGNYMPMGFVKLRVLTEDEIKQKEQQEAEQRKIELQKAEQKRIEREKQEKLKQQFDNLITEADNLFAEKQYEKAIEKYKEAQEIDKEADLTMYFQKCENTIEKQKEEQEQDRKRIENEEFLKQKKEQELKRQEENKRKKEQERKKLLEEGLTIPDDLRDFNKGKKIIEDFYKAKNEQQIEGANLQTLKKFIENCIKKTNKRWKKAGDKDWKLVEKWVGKETAQQWFNEIIR